MKLILLICNFFIFTFIYSDPLTGVQIQCSYINESEFLDTINRDYGTHFTSVFKDSAWHRTFYIHNIPYYLELKGVIYKNPDGSPSNIVKLEGLITQPLDRKAEQFQYIYCNQRGSFGEFAFQKIESSGEVNESELPYAIFIFGANNGAVIDSATNTLDYQLAEEVESLLENPNGDLSSIHISHVTFIDDYPILINQVKSYVDAFFAVVVNPGVSVGSHQSWQKFKFNRNFFVYPYLIDKKDINPNNSLILGYNTIGYSNIAKFYKYDGNEQTYTAYTYDEYQPLASLVNKDLNTDNYLTPSNQRLIHRFLDEKGINFISMGQLFYGFWVNVIRQIADNGVYHNNELNQDFSLVLVIAEYSVSAKKFIYQPLLLNHNYHSLDFSYWWDRKIDNESFWDDFGGGYAEGQYGIFLDDYRKLVHLTNKNGLVFACLYNKTFYTECTYFGIIGYKKEQRFSKKKLFIRTTPIIYPFIQKIITTIPDMQQDLNDGFKLHPVLSCAKLNKLKADLKKNNSFVWMIIGNKNTRDPIILKYNFADNTAQKFRLSEPRNSTTLLHLDCNTQNNIDSYSFETTSGHPLVRFNVRIRDFYVLSQSSYKFISKAREEETRF